MDLCNGIRKATTMNIANSPKTTSKEIKDQAKSINKIDFYYSDETRELYKSNKLQAEIFHEENQEIQGLCSFIKQFET